MNHDFMGTLPQWLQLGLAVLLAVVGGIKGWYSLSNESRRKVLAIAVHVLPYPAAVGALVALGVSIGIATAFVIPTGLCFQLLAKYNAMILKHLSHWIVDD